MPMNRVNYLYKESDTFEKKRRELLNDVVDYLQSETLKKGFSIRFYNFIDEIILRMMVKEEDFYSTFLSKTRREMDFLMDWPISSYLTNEDIHIVFNPISFLYLKEEEMEALIKHEILHIVLNHHEREIDLRRRYQRAAVNIALDISVNQYIKNVPGFSLKLSSVNLALNLNLELNETVEYYAKEIEKALVYDNTLINKIKEETSFDYNKVHDEWHRGENQSNSMVKDNVSYTVKSAAKDNVPSEIASILEGFKKGQINWRKEIANSIRMLPSLKRKTVMRRNRRQPERLDLKGELKGYAPEVIVAIDISASIENNEVKSFLTEMLPLTKEYRKSIRVMEVDEEIREDYEINSIKDIRNINDRTRGTKFSPVFERLKKENKRNALLIYFTDGKGEKRLEVKPINDTIWVVTGDEISLENPPGRVIYLNKGKEEINRALGLQTMRELLHEWAR